LFCPPAQIGHRFLVTSLLCQKHHVNQGFVMPGGKVKRLLKKPLRFRWRSAGAVN
jgi:hypothetical protein